ncbi:MarR family transcriptional regulator [Ignatzschineria rhizosphaerae]|uniref:MarR family transcriptional regulator n=1 Tax=Ignatzschineria rhizosphaerae TaxID=2923279 RepID=A0ABY3X382_9GAMM|nr:MarR family transcriptional regulator [Ignatzschineria rhizosphaerae]UNM97348.1 MarR family transcriptional regulator [Ignatzschineria rhizosphaerae]
MLDQKYQTFIALTGNKEAQELNNLALCMKLLSTTKVIDRSCAERLEKYQLSESRLLVLTLLQKKGTLSPLEIAEFCGVSKGSMTQQLNALFKDQLIEKESVPEDRRKYAVSLTAKGEMVIAEALKEHTAWIEAIASPLTDEEKSQLNLLLDKITHNVIHNF